MEKDLIIDVESAEVQIALLENHRLAELNKEKNDSSYLVGDVYLGKVKKVMPALNAAFVDIGDSKEAFMHYLDLGLNFRAFDTFVRQMNPNRDAKSFFSGIKIGEPLEKEGRINDVLQPGQPVIVQIVKEPISTKGSRLTAEISLAGRNLVLLPFAKSVNISQKITSKEERRRLERLIYSILPKNYGVIIRTAAEGKRAVVLDTELKSLIRKWEDSWPKVAKRKIPDLLFSETSKTIVVLRDLLNDSFSNIYVNDESVFREVKEYISTISPELEKIVKLYKGGEPIFDRFDVTRQIKGSFGKIVPLKQGAYIVIEHTEALNVVDVNSGIRAKNGISQEENSFTVNMNAADEIARQMRLRDLGGIVIVDFIDMDSPDNRNKLFRHMQDLLSTDRAKHNVLPLSKFGLMQITRQRVRPATEINVNEKCPMCHGTGEIAPSIVIDKTLERQLAYYVKEKKIKSFILETNPLLEAYLNKGFLDSIRKKWCRKYSCRIKLKVNSEYALLQTEWLNPSGEKIEEE
ncbi:MAG: Rne/Rng family ribonuclease [Bacteroidales bacterium]|jgi:ribonuclease G|nr:Rne/Rng family ribonuclease [Bacteroidales bacterium]